MTRATSLGSGVRRSADANGRGRGRVGVGASVRAVDRIGRDGGGGAIRVAGNIPDEETLRSSVDHAHGRGRGRGHGRGRRTRPEGVGRGMKTSRRGMSVVRRTGDIAHVTVQAGCGRRDCGCGCGWSCDPGHRSTREEAAVVVVEGHRTRAVGNREGWGSTSDRDTAGPPADGRRELEEAEADASANADVRTMRKTRTMRRP